MARIPTAEPIYQVANLFRDRCLINNDSLIWPDKQAWTVENLDKMWEAFIGHPDTSQLDFFDKWQKQLATQPDDIHRIAADIIAFYFLFTDVTTETKLFSLHQVLDWRFKENKPDLSFLMPAFSTKVGSSGMYYHTGRPWQVAFYIQFAKLMKSEKANPNSPTDCSTIASQAQKAIPYNSTAARNILLHLLFPDQFERIASSRNKVSIVKAFDTLKGEGTHIDDNLANIRKVLETELKRPNLDFYDDDIKAKWQPETKPIDEEIKEDTNYYDLSN